MAAKNEYEGAFVDEVYCVNFGCGEKLSFRERLFGNKCLRCSTKGEMVSREKTEEIKTVNDVIEAIAKLRC